MFIVRLDWAWDLKISSAHALSFVQIKSNLFAKSSCNPKLIKTFEKAFTLSKHGIEYSLINDSCFENKQYWRQHTSLFILIGTNFQMKWQLKSLSTKEPISFLLFNQTCCKIKSHFF